MHTYVVRRRDIAAHAYELHAALTRLRSTEEFRLTSGVRWLHSYVTRQPIGGFGLTCVVQADGEHALERHAVLTRLPAHEILPVAAMEALPDFAPTMVYLVRQRSAWPTSSELERSASLARRMAKGSTASGVRWLRRYAVRESDGMLGMIWVYQAVDTEALEKHAASVGVPVDEIVPLIGRVVYRGDVPSTQSEFGATVV
ncbi:MAG: hypothetical protein WCA17_11255 [Burkholderiales bacterium]